MITMIKIEKNVSHEKFDQEDVIAPSSRPQGGSRIKLQAGFKLRECFVDLRKMSTSEILKWQRPNAASPNFIDHSADILQPDESTSSSADPPFQSLPYEQPMHHLYMNDDAIDPLSEPLLPHNAPSPKEQELKRTVTHMQYQLTQMKEVVRNQQDVINKLRLGWVYKQRKPDQIMGDTVQKLNISRGHQVPKSPANELQVSADTPDPHSTFKLIQPSCQELGAEFDPIHHGLYQTVDAGSVERGCKQIPTKEYQEIQPTELPGIQIDRSDISSFHARNRFENSQMLDQSKECYSSEVVEPDPIPPKRLQIQTRTLPEMGDDVNHELIPRFDELMPLHSVSEPQRQPPQAPVRNHSLPAATKLSQFFVGWFDKVQSSQEPPTLYQGYCLSCYTFSVKIHNRHCLSCWSKVNRARTYCQKNPIPAMPQCIHNMNRPMSGCDACILRTFVLRYNILNLKNCFVAPDDKIDDSVRRTCQRTEPASSPAQPTFQKVKTPILGSLLEQGEQPKQATVSAFPDNWFLVVPDYANKPPTPRFGCCYSCYEYSSRLHLQHCETCWSKAMSLKESYLKDPKKPSPQCTHKLNRPMRGCEACILRAFIVRYNCGSPCGCFPVPLVKLCSNKKKVAYVTPQHKIDKIETVMKTVSSSFLQVEGTVESTIQPVQPDATSNHVQSIPLDVESLLSSMPKQWKPREDLCVISNFPQDWFLVVPDDPNERPTPHSGCCVSCYEFRRTTGKEKLCKPCRSKAKIIGDRYLDNPDTALPSCTHRLNRPMRGCDSCSLRAYIIVYNISNPVNLFPVPYDKLEFGCLILKNGQNIKREPIDQDEPLNRSNSIGQRILQYSRPMQPTQNLQPQTIITFPDGWFHKVPSDPYELPTPRYGCCISCYEYKATKVTVGEFCLQCRRKADLLKSTFLHDPSLSLPHCIHQLNLPMRGCNVCILRAYIVRYNRINSSSPFEVPYESIDFEMPAHKLNQIMKSGDVFGQGNHTQRDGPLDSSIDQEHTKSTQNESLPIQFLNRQEHDFNYPNTFVSPTQSIHRVLGSPSCSLKTSEPFPDDWFLKVSFDANLPPTPRPSHCFSCYEFKQIHEDFCTRCISRLHRLRQNYLREPEKPVLLCSHQLNQPMRNCGGCVFQAFIFHYERRNKCSYFQLQ